MNAWREAMLLVDALALKWRILMVITAVILCSGFSVWFLDVMQHKHQSALQKLRTLPVLAQQAKGKIAGRLKADNSKKIKQLKQQLEQAGRELDHLKFAQLDYMRQGSGLQQLRRTVNGLLRQHVGLRLLNLETLAAEPLLPQPIEQTNGTPNTVASTTLTLTKQTAAADDAPATEDDSPAFSEGMYKYPVHLTIRGKYIDLLIYMEQLESASLQVFWHELILKVDAYPYATLSLQLYALSKEDS